MTKIPDANAMLAALNAVCDGKPAAPAPTVDVPAANRPEQPAFDCGMDTVPTKR